VTEPRPKEKGDAEWLRAYNTRNLGKKYQKILDTERRGGTVVARTVPEELCHEESPKQMRQELERLLADPDLRNVVLDLSSVNYVASTFVGTLLWLKSALAPRAGDVRLSGVHWRVHELLELCQVYKMIPSHPRVDEAVDAMSNKKSA
jgi:anti-anti-sigma factor